MADNSSGPDNNIFTVLAFVALLLRTAERDGWSPGAPPARAQGSGRG